MLRRGKMAFFQGTGKKNGFLRSIFTSPFKGAEDGDGDDDDEPAAAAKKARVVEGDETDDG